MGSMLDAIGGANMLQGNATTFTFDRFGCSNEALSLNGGYTTVPSGIYFDTPQFTITVWLYPQQVEVNSMLFDFGNGQYSDNIFIGLADNSGSPLPYFYVLFGANTVFQYQSPLSLAIGVWQLLAITYDGAYSQMYINGTLMTNIEANYTMTSITRNICYIGKSNCDGFGYSYSFIDDLRFYNKCLTQSEIIQLMNKNMSGLNYYFIL